MTRLENLRVEEGSRDEFSYSVDPYYWISTIRPTLELVAKYFIFPNIT